MGVGGGATTAGTRVRWRRRLPRERAGSSPDRCGREDRFGKRVAHSDRRALLALALTGAGNTTPLLSRPVPCANVSSVHAHNVLATRRPPFHSYILNRSALVLCLVSARRVGRLCPCTSHRTRFCQRGAAGCVPVSSACTSTGRRPVGNLGFQLPAAPGSSA